MTSDRYQPCPCGAPTYEDAAPCGRHCDACCTTECCDGECDLSRPAPSPVRGDLQGLLDLALNGEVSMSFVIRRAMDVGDYEFAEHARGF